MLIILILLISILLLWIFHQSRRLSRQEKALTRLTQLAALEEFFLKERGE